MSYDIVREIKRNPDRAISIDNAAKIARALEIDMASFFGALTGAVSVSGFVTQIPRYDARLSAGRGAINFEASKIDIPIPFAPDFLEKKLGRVSQDGLVIVEAAGESMEPTIADGDLIMVDTLDTERRAGIFGYDLGGETYVKRLEWTEYGVQVISDNSHYPERALNADKAAAEGFRLIGRVVWVGRVF